MTEGGEGTSTPDGGGLSDTCQIQMFLLAKAWGDNVSSSDLFQLLLSNFPPLLGIIRAGQAA